MADFGVTEDGHPDEIALPASNATDNQNTSKPPMNNQQNPMQPPSKPPVRNNTSQPQQQPQHRGPQTPNQRPSAPAQVRPNPGQAAKPPFNKAVPPAHSAAQQASGINRTGTPPPPTGGTNGAASEPVSFFSARSVPQLPEGAPPENNVIPSASAKVFDPRAESPSIRKTPGIDHRSSRPVSKNGQHVAPTIKDPDQPRPGSQLAGGVASPGLASAGSGPGRPGMGGIGNPSLNHARQIGAPGAGGSPLSNRSQYRPPTIKRPAPGPAENGSRPPLTEASTNLAVNNGAGTGMDPKRQKMA